MAAPIAGEGGLASSATKTTARAMAANTTGPALPTNMTEPALAANMNKTLPSDMTSMEMPGMCLVDNLNFATVFLILISTIANSRPKNTGRVAQFQAMDNTYDFIVIGGGTAGCVVANRYYSG